MQSDADEDLRLLGRRIAVLELRDVARADRLAEAQESAGALGDLHGQQCLAMLAELGPLADVAQAVEIHVGATVDCDVSCAACRMLLEVAFEPGNGERPRWFHDGAAVLENVLDGCADLVRVDEDDGFDDLASDAKSLVADAAYGDTVGENTYAVQRDGPSVQQSIMHAGGIDRLDTDDFDCREKVLDIGADPAHESAAADGHEHGDRHFAPLPRELDGDGPLTGNDGGIGQRVGELEGLRACELERARIRVVVLSAVQHDLSAQRAHGFDFDRSRVLGHYDEGAYTAALRRQCDALRGVAP